MPRVLFFWAATLVLGIGFPAIARSAEPTCKACSSDTCSCPKLPAPAPVAKAGAPGASVRREGSWLIEETENFQICRPVGYKVSAEVAESFETLRQKLCQAWSPHATDKCWSPKCHVVIHARFEGYLKEVGPGGRQTTGSSLIDFDKDQVVMRRIDIRGDRPGWFAEAVAHELTHVVLADRFAHVQIPHWADEGMAIQADPAGKRHRHGKDLDAALAARREFRLAELLMLSSYPHPSRMGTFYGQSASLVNFLTHLGDKEQLVTFVDLATSRGYDVALREIYDIPGVGALEQQWRRHLRSPQATAETVSRDHTRESPRPAELAAVKPSTVGIEAETVVAALVE